MPTSFADIAFTPSVQALQSRHGSRTQYARMQTRAGEATLSARERDFLQQADTFYLATVGETGWPYVQHRGGPPGFVHVRSPSQVAFADFRGNLQYVSAGNVARDDRASIIVVDGANRQRLKLLGHLHFVDLAGIVRRWRGWRCSTSWRSTGTVRSTSRSASPPMKSRRSRDRLRCASRRWRRSCGTPTCALLLLDDRPA